MKNTSAFDLWCVFFSLFFSFFFFVCRCVGEYVSQELFCFVNLTSSCSLIFVLFFALVCERISIKIYNVESRFGTGPKKRTVLKAGLVQDRKNAQY